MGGVEKFEGGSREKMIWGREKSKNNREKNAMVSLFRDFEEDKTFTSCWSGLRKQGLSLSPSSAFQAHSRHLAITPKRNFRVISEDNGDMTAKSMPKLLGQCSGTALACWRGKLKHMMFPYRDVLSKLAIA